MTLAACRVRPEPSAGASYHGAMDTPLPPLMTFPTLDEAESALDWIGVDFADAAGGFEGELTDDDRELLEAAIGDPDSPGPVRVLAEALRGRLDAAAAGAGPSWRVAFAA